MSNESSHEALPVWTALGYFEGGAVFGDGQDVHFDVTDPATGEMRRARISAPTFVKHGLATIACQDFEFSFSATPEMALTSAAGFANHLADVLSFHTTKPIRAGIKSVQRVGDAESTLIPMRAVAAGYSGEHVGWNAIAELSALMADGERHLAKRSMRWLRRSYTAFDIVEAYVAAAIAVESLRPTFPEPPQDWVTKWRADSGSTASGDATKAERTRYFAVSTVGIESTQWSKVWTPRDQVLHGALTEDNATVDMLGAALPDLRRVAVRGIVAALGLQPGVLQGAERPQVVGTSATLMAPGLISFLHGAPKDA